jgi:hypothetical protein
MSFELHRNLKFNKTNYDYSNINVGNIVFCENQTGYYIGRCDWVDYSVAKSLYIDDIGEAFSIYDCRLANQKEIEKYNWSRNYMYSYFYYESKVKSKTNKIRNIIGEIFCYLPIPFFGVFWFIMYGFMNDRLSHRADVIVIGGFSLQLISSILIPVIIINYY